MAASPLPDTLNQSAEAMATMEANAVQAQETMSGMEQIGQQVGDVFGNAFSSMATALINGKNAGEAFLKSMIQGLAQLASRLAPKAIQSFFSNLGGGGGLFGGGGGRVPVFPRQGRRGRLRPDPWCAVGSDDVPDVVAWLPCLRQGRWACRRSGA